MEVMVLGVGTAVPDGEYWPGVHLWQRERALQ